MHGDSYAVNRMNVTVASHRRPCCSKSGGCHTCSSSFVNVVGFLFLEILGSYAEKTIGIQDPDPDQLDPVIHNVQSHVHTWIHGYNVIQDRRIPWIHGYWIQDPGCQDHGSWILAMSGSRILGNR